MNLKVLNPKLWCDSLYTFLKPDIHFVQKRVLGFKVEEDKIVSVITSEGGEEYKMDKYIISAGIGSVKIGKMLGINIPLLAFKGLSLDVHHKDGEGLKETIIDASKQSAFVRMGKISRFTSFGDVEGTNLEINPLRRDQIRRFAKEQFPEDYDESKENLWVGL